jgi:hypothetical protein
MAESVKRRVAAARLAVAFVAAGTIAGAGAWASASPAPEAHSSAYKLKAPSFKAFQKLNDSFFKFKKADTAFKSSIKGELGGVQGDVNTIKGEVNAIKGELPGYIKMSDADARYIKMNQAIMGDGSVFTGTQAISKGAPAVTLADVPGQLKVEATDTQFKITNESGSPLTHTACGVGAAGGSLAPGASLTCTSREQADTLQFVNGDGHVVTLNFSNVATQAGSQATVQILVGL